jgi:hypothetical protein
MEVMQFALSIKPSCGKRKEVGEFLEKQQLGRVMF